MARSRRHYRRRPNVNYVWQSVVFQDNVETPNSVAQDTTIDWLLPQVTPGVGFERGAATELRPFNNEHVLERVVGAMAHNGSGQPGNFPGWTPVSIGAVKIPEGLQLGTGGINLFDATDADDYLFRMDAVCNVSTGDAIPNWHEVNSKARRKFEVGDVIQFLASAWFEKALTRASTIEIAVNLRFLWKLN